MLPKKSRILRKDFPALLSSRNFFHSDHFILRNAVSPDKFPHIAISVSKKISKKATIRNTVRRRVYSVIYPDLKKISPFQILFVAKSGAEKIKGQELKEEIKQLLLKAKCL